MTTAPIPPRLLTDAEAAAYVRIPATEFRRLGIGRVQLGSKVRFDRQAIDRWIDAQGGLAPISPPQGHVANDETPNEVDEAVAHFRGLLDGTARPS